MWIFCHFSVQLHEQSNTMDWINSWELLWCLSALQYIFVLSKPNTPSWHSEVYVMYIILSCSYFHINVRIDKGNRTYTGDITYRIHRFLKQHIHIIVHLPGQIPSTLCDKRHARSGNSSKAVCWQSPLWWRHNGHDCVSNHQPHHCLLNRLFGRRSK